MNYRNILIRALCSLFAIVVAGSCQPRNGKNEEPIDPQKTNYIELSVSNDTTIHMLCGETFVIDYKIKKGDLKIKSSSPEWSVALNNGSEKKIEITSPSIEKTSDNKQFDLVVCSTDESVSEKQRIHFKIADLTERGGMYVLSEGNMTTENGSIAYITPDGGLVDNVYRRVNGTELGNVAQDMFIHDGKAYIISQNGEKNAVGNDFENDGMLIIVDLKTFKKIKSYKKSQLSKMEWPTHIATLDGQNIYIRAKNGIWHLDNNSEELSLVEEVTPNKSGGDYMPVNNTNPSVRFAILNNKIYYASYYSQWRSGIIKEIVPGKKIAKDRKLPIRNAAIIDKIVDVIPSQDGKLWILGEQNQVYKLFKFDVNKEYGSKELLPYNVITEEIKVSGNSNKLAFMGDRIFFLDPEQTVIYHFNWSETALPEAKKGIGGTIESWENTPQAEELVDFFDIDSDARSFYNGFAINPLNKKLYIYTMKSNALWNKSGKIYEIDPNGNNSENMVLRKWEKVGRFPAGFFFNK